MTIELPDDLSKRPTSARGGLGKTPQEGLGRELDRLTPFQKLADVLSLWRAQTLQFGVSGAHSHDCHLIAFMRAHGVTSLLTPDAKDFRRYAPLGIASTNPASVLIRIASVPGDGEKAS